MFGRVPLEWPFFPGSATPGWVVEGLATYYESEFTQAGRVRGSFHEMVVRTAILEGRFETIDQTSGDSPLWPGGQRYYVYGSLFLKYLMDQHGREAMGAFVKAVAGQWIPYRLNSAARDAFGVSFSEAWEEWRAGLEGRYAALRDSLEQAPLTEGEALTGEGYYAWSPEPSPDGMGSPLPGWTDGAIPRSGSWTRTTGRKRSWPGPTTSLSSPGPRPAGSSSPRSTTRIPTGSGGTSFSWGSVERYRSHQGGSAGPPRCGPGGRAGRGGPGGWRIEPFGDGGSLQWPD